MAATIGPPLILDYSNYSVTVEEEELELKKDKLCIVNGQMDMAEYNINSKNPVSFATLDDTIATVTSNGGIKALKIGETEIKVYTEYSEALISIEVVDHQEALEIVDDECTMEINSIKYILSDDSNRKNDGVKFVVDGESVKVSEHGIVTACNPGVSKVSMTDQNGITKNIKVHVFEKFDTIDFTDPYKINVFGRAKIEKTKLTVYHGVSGFECKFEGTEIKATIESNCSLSPYAYIKVYVDDQEYSIGLDKGAKAEYVLASDLAEGTHNIRVLKREIRNKYPECRVRVIIQE